MGWNGRVEPLGGNRLRLDWNLKQKGIKPGDTLVLRNYNPPPSGMRGLPGAEDGPE